MAFMQASRALLGFAAFGWLWGTWGAVLPGIQRQAGIGDGALGLALLCIGAGALVSMRPAGAWIDRRGAGALPLTMAAFAGTAALPGAASSALALGAVLVLLGMTSGAVDVGINAEAARVEAGGRRVMHLAHGLFSAGVVASSLAAGAAQEAGASARAVLAGCAVALAVAAAALTRLPAAAAPRSTARAAGLRALAQVPKPLAVIGALVAVAFVVENAWQSWAAVHLRGELGASPGAAALGPAAFAIAAMAGRLLAQPLAGRVPDRVMLAVGAAVAAGASLLAATAGSVPVALAGIAGAGLGTSVLAPTLLGLAGRHASADERASAVSVVTTIGYLGFLLGPALVGLTADATSLPTALALVGALAAGLALAARLAPAPT
jgi:predicted MFS family arabinose efflux permease